MVGTFDSITTISLCFSNEKIDRIAGDSISLDTLFDADRNTVNTDAVDETHYSLGLPRASNSDKCLNPIQHNKDVAGELVVPLHSNLCHLVVLHI
jgi:hypothetical protein